ncbi:uncharacterized protein LOC100263372 isoform X1 [Vitis vinifera]|uniref:uncharacterized protein LOC100263372 isoform X1 n=1 Tax=Vitis vinifera TaxID=29760 RepID=UPI0028834823|nr:uncharacterized protein LOC100263372 isoform X1 [Vitis vinifera]
MLVVISKHVLNIGSFDPNPIRKIHDMIWILSPTYCRQLASMENLPIMSETLISESDSDPPSTCPQGSPEHPDACRSESKPTELLRALEVVERDSVAIAESFTSLFASLRLALSEKGESEFLITGLLCCSIVWLLAVLLIICGASMMLQAASRNQHSMQLQGETGI